MVIYGVVLILIVTFAPRGISGCGQSAARLFSGRAPRAGE